MPALPACVGSDMHTILLDFISGVSVGVEFFLGEDLAEGDKFAMTLDLFIVRFTYVISEKEV